MGKVDLFDTAWAEMFPNRLSQDAFDPHTLIDFEIEYIMMKNWIAVNRSRTKWKRFITNWLNNAMRQNRIGTIRVKDYGKAGQV